MKFNTDLFLQRGRILITFRQVIAKRQRDRRFPPVTLIFYKNQLNNEFTIRESTSIANALLKSNTYLLHRKIDFIMDIIYFIIKFIYYLHYISYIYTHCYNSEYEIL